MTIEVEQKFRVAEPDLVRKKLGALGAKFHEPITQVDVYFAHPQRDFAQTDEALRLRRIGLENYMTYKGPRLDQTTKTRHEIELGLAAGSSSAADAADLLEALGFRRVATVTKQRSEATFAFQKREITACFDEVDKIGSFMEIECLCPEAETDQARQVILQLATELSLADVERSSYLELLLALTGDRPGVDLNG